MAAKLPYMASPGLVTKILTKIQEARKPDRFTQDFLETKLGFPGGSARPIIPLLKRMNFLNSDGTPTPLYDRFRNVTTQSPAVAEGVRNAYAELFDRNRYAGDLTKEKLKALIVEVTGAAHDDRTVELTLSTILKLKEQADFDATVNASDEDRAAATNSPVVVNGAGQEPIYSRPQALAEQTEEVGLNLSYTINLVLPETTNPEVFNTIFKSLKDNLLKK
ncbi:MAG: DUF5343 domain-containing protein [Hyphomicrobium sp.]|jgi:hypothetical protein